MTTEINFMRSTKNLICVTKYVKNPQKSVTIFVQQKVLLLIL